MGGGQNGSGGVRPDGKMPRLCSERKTTPAMREGLQGTEGDRGTKTLERGPQNQMKSMRGKGI